jgi:hypothetical protein
VRPCVKVPYAGIRHEGVETALCMRASTLDGDEFRSPVTLSPEEDIPLSSGLFSESRRRGRFRRDGDEGIPVIQPVTLYRMDWAHSAPH